MKYMEGQDKGEDPVETAETVSCEQRILEEVMLGLRRRKGLLVSSVIEKMDELQQERFLKKLTLFEQENFIRSFQGRIYLNNHVLAIENEIAVKLLE